MDLGTFFVGGVVSVVGCCFVSSAEPASGRKNRKKDYI
jgi:hypothetical protein